MVVILIFIVILFLAMQTLSLRKVAVTNLRESILATGAFTGLIAVCSWVWTIASGEQISIPTVVWGFGLGLAFVSTIIVYYYAMKTGPLSYSTFMFSASMVIPSVAGIIFWQEKAKPTIIIGLVLFLLSFYFISVAGKGSNSKISKKWIVFCFLSWAFNGCGSLVSKIQQTIMKGTESMSMLTVSFSFAFILCTLSYLFIVASSKKKVSLKEDMSIIKVSFMPIVLVALGSGAGNAIVIYLSSRVPSAYLFPFVLGGLIIVVTIYSRFVLKEVLTKYGMIGIAIGLAAIVTLNL